MNILIIGGGGREHSLCWAVSKSPKCKKLFCIPGNGGIAEIATCIEKNPENQLEIFNFCKKTKIDLVIIGPEKYLEQGLSDYLRKRDINVFGPSKKASKIETSKTFSKHFLKRNSIPTADYHCFNEINEAKKYIKCNNPPYVIKVDGLASGKGVLICKTKTEANNTLKNIFVKKIFGNAGKKILIEEHLDGFEVSFFSFFDKNKIVMLDYALDHKRAFDGDNGPNTGGMGAFTPSKKITRELYEKIFKTIIEPTKQSLDKEQIIFQGILFFGIMVTENGPKVIEYNVRFGDPECQSIVRKVKSNFLDILYNTATNKLKEVKSIVNNNFSVCVILASKGYPERFETNLEIKNIEKANKVKGVIIFHCGTKLEDKKIFSNGGRVLAITAVDSNFLKAREKVYKALKIINWKHGFFRNDIGFKNF